MKLIAIDLDGTLLNSKKMISAENAEAIQLALENNTEVIIATGRHYQDAKRVIQRSGVDLPIIGSNGASLHTLEGECLMTHPIDREDAFVAFEQLQKLDIPFVVLGAKYVYTLDYCFPSLELEIEAFKTPETEEDMLRLKSELLVLVQESPQWVFHTPKDLLEVDDDFLNILSICYDPEKRHAGMSFFSENTQLHVFSSYMNNFEMTHGEVSKGNAVKAYANSRGIKDYDIMAIGDNFNDQSMIHMAGIGVAMGNAVPHIKTISDFVTRTNNEHGVAHAIHTILLNSEK